jgi:hypothetical protein
MQRLRIVSAVLAGAAVLATATACGDTDEEKGTDEPVVVKIDFENGKVEPNGKRIDVAAGQPVDLEVTADEPGELHVHSDPEQEFAYQAGTKTFEIQIDRPGVVAVESHDLDQVIVQLEVR